MAGRRRGLSLLEIVVVVAILGILSLAAVPYAELTYVRANETQLEEGLRQIREALARWKKDCETAAMKSLGREKFNQMQECYFYLPQAGAGAHPLGKLLVGGQETINGLTYSGAPLSFNFYHLPYLARLPVDPFVGAASWTVHFASVTPRIGIFDVSPLASNVVNLDGTPARRGFDEAIDGTLYESW